MTEAEKFLKVSVCGYCKQGDPLKCKQKCVVAKYAEKGYLAGVAAEKRRQQEKK